MVCDFTQGLCKTDMLDRKQALSSQSVADVKQEEWFLLLTYTLIEREMALTALEHCAKVCVMRFKSSLLFVHDFLISRASDRATGRLPEHLRRLRDDLWCYRLLSRRRERA